MMKLITIGDNVVDCYLDQKTYYPGGNCVNVAVNAKRNGAEKVSYIGIFGTDDKAGHIQYSLDEEQIDYSFSRTAFGLSGQPQVTLTEEGDRVFVGGPANTVQRMFKLQLLQEELEFVSGFDLCHVSCYSSMESELEKLSKVIPVSYDFSSNLDLDYIRSIAKYITYAFFSAADLSDDQLKQFIKDISPLGFNVAGLTRGGKPAMFVYNGESYEQKLRPITVVDTMGAGDSLISGFLVHFLSGASIETALAKGTESAEKTCQFFGGYGYPKPF